MKRRPTYWPTRCACVDAARQVPEGRAYDCFRAEFVAEAAQLAVSAAGREARQVHLQFRPGEIRSGSYPHLQHALGT